MSNTTNRGEPMYSGRVSCSRALSGNRPVTLVRFASTPICSVRGHVLFMLYVFIYTDIQHDFHMS